ncbi:MAG: hypothetical protein FWG44_01240 [Oscillospiraceae bacterium]|nr:hypothetical protein [Oscillospiraceae bacterium]
MSNIEWLWLNNAEIDAEVLSLPERLSRHGYALMINRLETKKIQAAELCVNDVLTKTEKPNIIVIAPEHLVKSWYSAFLWDMGVEFKYLSVNDKTPELISPSISNLCMMTSESLIKSKGNSITAKTVKENQKFVWDLMVIDLPFSCKINTDAYINAIGIKADKLLINAPAPDDFGETCENLSTLVKHLLKRNEKKRREADFSADELKDSIIAGRNMEGNYTVKTISYKGENKTGAFLKETETILSNPENRTVIYCTAQNTVTLVKNALSEFYKDSKSICVYDSGVNEAEFISGEFKGESITEPQIIITNDLCGTMFINTEKITHIINYEYPENPAVLEQRYARGGRKAAKENPVFYLFCDEEYKTDGKILRESILSESIRMFCGHIPDKSLLFDIPDIEEHLTVLILDLKFVAGEAGKEKLQKLLPMLDLAYILKENEIDGERVFGEITEKIAVFRNKRVFLDENMVLHTADDLPEKPEKDIKANIPEIREALKAARKLTGKETDFKIIAEETSALSDNMKLAALIGIWKHCKYELKIPRTYQKFIELYNKV